MKLIYDCADRKRLVHLIAEITGCEAKYMGAPTFNYQVDYITIDRDGTLHIDDMANRELIDRIKDRLKSEGFVEEYTDEPRGLAIQMPMLTDTELTNLHALLTAKGTLIKKALGVNELPVEIIDDRLNFEWFSAESTPEEIQAYSTFIATLCVMAKNQKRISSKEKEVDNEKYAFRCFLLRLGFIGDKYKTHRKILLQNLTGSAAFKSGQKKEDVSV